MTTDTLDFASLQSRAQGYISTMRRIRNRAIITLLVLGIALFFVWGQINRTPGALYRYGADGWQPMYENINAFVVTDDGMWLYERSNTCHCLRHMSAYGVELERFYLDEIAPSGFSIETNLAYNDGQLWAAGGDDVLHYVPGRGWLFYENWLQAGNPVQLVAGPYGTFISFASGDIQHRHRSGETPDVPTDFTRRVIEAPRLVQDEAGTLYTLIGGQLWQFDSYGWQQLDVTVPSELHLGRTADFVRVVGLDDRWLWVETSEGVAYVDVDTSEIRHEAASGRTPRIYALASNGPQLAIATENGISFSDLTSSDDFDWIDIPQPPTPLTVRDVGFTQSGTLLALAVGAGDWMLDDLNDIQRTAVIVAPFLLLLILYVIFLVPYSKLGTYRIEQAQYYIANMLPDVPQQKPDADDSQPTSGRAGLKIILLLVLCVAAVVFLTQQIGLPWWLALVGCFIGLRLVQIGLNQPKPGAPTRAAQLWDLSLLVIATMAIILSTVPIGALLMALTGDPLLTQVVGMLLALAVGFTIYRLLLYIPLIWMLYLPLRRADYATALRRVEWACKQVPGHVGFEQQRAVILTFAGRTEDAVGHLQTIINKTSAYNALGRISLFILQAQLLDNIKRHDAAKPYHIANLQIAPDVTLAYTALARHYLMQETNPQRALELVNAWPVPINKPRLDLFMGGYSWAYQHMIKAWALAANGQTEAALALGQDALATCNRWYKPGLAAMHLYMARLFNLADDPEAARPHYEQAAALDPDGANGKEAREKL